MARLTLLDTNKTGKQAHELENSLRSLIVGQDEAIHAVVKAYQSHTTGLNPAGRPIGNFLFLGPTGSGKTRVVEALAQSLLNDSKAVVKIDCAEYQHSHEIAKLIGCRVDLGVHAQDRLVVGRAVRVFDQRQLRFEWLGRIAYSV